MQANKSAESEHVEQSKSQDLSLFEKQDDIATFVQGLEGSSDYSEEEARRVRWKMDLIMLPMASDTIRLHAGPVS